MVSYPCLMKEVFGMVTSQCSEFICMISAWRPSTTHSRLSEHPKHGFLSLKIYLSCFVNGLLDAFVNKTTDESFNRIADHKNS